MTTISASAPATRTTTGRGRLGGVALLAGGGTLIVAYLSLIVLIPIAALATHGLYFSVHADGHGLAFWEWSWSLSLASFWADVTAAAAVKAMWLSTWLSLSVAAINTVMGVAIAWVLQRDSFRGRSVLESVIDLPFALPNIVAGVVLLALYGPDSPVHVDLFETWMGLMVALLFVTLPFSVRAVQPVLSTLERDGEDAARTLGASGARSFLSVTFPSLGPAVLSGFGLAFARAIGEFGSISLIAGGIGRTTVGATYAYNLTQGFEWPQAAAVSTALLLISLVVLVASSALAARFQRRLGQ